MNNMRFKLTKTYLYQRTNEYAVDEEGREATTSIDTTDELEPYYTIYEYEDGEWEEYDSTCDKDKALEEYKALIKGEQ